jgi:hypothetical protein
MFTVQEAVASLKDACKNPCKEPFTGEMQVNDEIRQGDVIVKRISELSKDGTRAATADEKFTVANSHVLDGAKVFAVANGNFEFSVDNEAILKHNDSTHPDDSHRQYHFHQGCYGVSFQTDLATKKRVVD